MRLQKSGVGKNLKETKGRLFEQKGGERENGSNGFLGFWAFSASSPLHKGYNEYSVKKRGTLSEGGKTKNRKN